MKGKIVPVVFLMLVLLIGFPSSVANFTVFADDDDNDNLYVSSEKFEDDREDAAEAIEDAEKEIDKARKKIERESNKGKETTLAQEQLDEAIAKLEMAEHSFSLGNFEEAEELAEEAEDLASEARGKLIGKTESDIEDEHEVEEHEVDEYENDEHEVDEYENDEHEVDEYENDEHEVEIKGEIDEIDLVSMFFTLVGSLLQIFVNEDTEFKNFDEFSDLMPGFLVKVEIILSDDSHVATEIKIKDNGDEKDDKVTLCHIPKGNPSNAHTITVGAPAFRAHMAHGDLEGLCDDGDGTIFDKYEDKLKKKLDKLEELRSKFEQKQIELAQKFADKQEKLTAKYAEKEAKRAAKLLEKVESGEYYKDFIEVDAQYRTFVISFGTDAVPPLPPLQGESIGQSSEISEFSGSITLKTSSSIDTRGTTKFIVEDCEFSNGGITYSCEYGKARTISSGPGGEKNSLVIIATLGSDDQEKRTGLKLSIETGEDIRALEDGSFDVTVHSPQSKITHEWFLGGSGKMTLLTESTEGSNGT